MVKVFEKVLTDTEIKCKRLFYPTGELGILPFREGKLDAEFPVGYRHHSHEHAYNFRCIKREGKYAKPTIAKGWSQMVRDKGLQIGDKLEFHKEENHHFALVPYWIEIYRNGTLLD